MPTRAPKNFSTVDISSMVVLVLSIAVFFYCSAYRSLQWNKNNFRSKASDLTAEIQQIETRKTEVEKAAGTIGSSPVVQTSAKTLPQFLEALNAQLQASGMELDHLRKAADREDTYQFMAYAPFNSLLTFLFITEQTNMAIEDLDIHPYSNNRHLVNIGIRLISNEMTPKDLAEFKKRQKRFTDIRDPFKETVVKVIAKEAGPPPPINWTWKYKLTGIGFDREKYATIDHRNYHKGDTFYGAKVVSIGNDRVDLRKGDLRYFIQFRRKK